MSAWVSYALRQGQLFKPVLVSSTDEGIECLFCGEHRLIVICVKITTHVRSDSPCQLAVFSSKLASIEPEIGCKLQFDPRDGSTEYKLEAGTEKNNEVIVSIDDCLTRWGPSGF